MIPHRGRRPAARHADSIAWNGLPRNTAAGRVGRANACACPGPQEASLIRCPTVRPFGNGPRRGAPGWTPYSFRRPTRVIVTYSAAASSAMIRWTARSVIPTRVATARMVAFGSAARQKRTWAWFVRKVHAVSGPGAGFVFLATSNPPRGAREVGEQSPERVRVERLEQEVVEPAAQGPVPVGRGGVPADGEEPRVLHPGLGP